MAQSATPLTLVMRWLSEPMKATADDLPPGLCVSGSTLAIDTLNAAEDAWDTWFALRWVCRELRHERGARNLETARDIFFYHLEVYEEWRHDAELGL